jgi:hypothetical protein
MTREERIEKLRLELLPDPPPPTAEQLKAQRKAIAQERWDTRQREMADINRQRAIDFVWERTLAARAEIEAGAARCCHRGPGDRDWGR